MGRARCPPIASPNNTQAPCRFSLPPLAITKPSPNHLTSARRPHTFVRPACRFSPLPVARFWGLGVPPCIPSRVRVPAVLTDPSGPWTTQLHIAPKLTTAHFNGRARLPARHPPKPARVPSHHHEAVPAARRHRGPLLRHCRHLQCFRQHQRVGRRQSHVRASTRQ